ncbi:MAG: hypothetical protein ABI995_09080 [Acidobacteriota bacterium]
MFSASDWNQLETALRNPADLDTFVTAAARIHKEATFEDVSQLTVLLNDDDALLREAAAWPLSELVGTPVLRELLKAYQRGLDDGLDDDGFSAALIDLVQVDPVQSESVLKVLVNEADLKMRDNACWLLEFCVNSL